MKTINRFVISSAECLRDPEPAVVVPDPVDVRFSTLLARAVQATLGFTTLAALANEHLGVVAALVLTVLILPAVVLGLTVAWRWHRDGDGSALCSDTLRRAFASALVAPAVALPGALLGWVGVGALIFAMALALAALLSKNG